MPSLQRSQKRIKHTFNSPLWNDECILFGVEGETPQEQREAQHEDAAENSERHDPTTQLYNYMKSIRIETETNSIIIGFDYDPHLYPQ